ncbi:FUSC family protein [Bradyrhizobium genosp. A]|uniref:FUSC family protein n=1 Tax=Bradyrhizobium genosp. A TaxID=83626 RepID=UPI003CF3B86D
MASRLRLGIAIEHGRFVLRCAFAASLAYVFACWAGLLHPVWAPISALIVSQESLSATHSSVFGRFVGTLIGVLVALLVHRLGKLGEIPLTPQIAIAVAICAIFAKERPSIRVCLWTVPLVLVTPTNSESAEVAAFFRGCDVMIGAAVGALVHLSEERLLAPVVRRLRRRYAHRRAQALAIPTRR